MTLVVGLGNMGPEYEGTRHNAGFMLVDLLLKGGEFSPIASAKFKGELYKTGPTLLLKPHTYMNASGLSVRAVRDFYKCSRLIVAHDDIDLNLGTLRFKKGGGNGGHNGLKSIDALCGPEYERVRIGVGRAEDVSAFVLSAFTAEEGEILSAVLLQGVLALRELCQGQDLGRVASLYSLRA